MKELSPERWRAVRELFADALELPESDLEGFLERASGGDAELREEVRSLLAAHRRAGGFMATPAGSLADPAPVEPPAASPPGGLGPYRLLGELGRGGMGHVYLAERSDGAYSKRVAVKVLAADLDGEEARLRFHGERQILADLDHPGIARLLDGGTAADGRPYLVMELIEGEPIDEYCDRRRLDVGARVELFARVCAAVGYAHRRLVVHRDLKPSHIVIAAGGEPKLLDFGIAKLLAPGASAPRATTAPMARLLTPGYASPEQLRGGQATPASDVYSLGVVLYELLCGRPPYRIDGDLKAVIETVCEIDPPPPSAARWPVPADDSDPGRAAAAARAATPRSLRRRLAGDLDAITLRALAKEPGRRFAAADELAADLDRHRRGEPVLTRAASFGYRLRRRLRRNKPMTAAVAIALVGALAAAGTIQRQRAAARRQVELAQEFGQRGQELVALMQQAAMLPSHDVRSDRARASRRMDSIRRRARDLGPAAAVPASYALGLGHLALDQLEEARSELEEAWRGGLQTPTVAYALGEAYARLYRRDRLLVAPARGGGDDRGGGAGYREEALAMLERSRSAETANPDYIAAQIAFAEGDNATALAAARRSAAAQPWRYQSLYLAAEALRELAIASADDGDYDLASERFDESRRTTETAIEVARSDPMGWVLACGLEVRRSVVGLDTGELNREAMVQALSLCDRALAIDPESIDARVVKMNLWHLIAGRDVRDGMDPTPALTRGLEILAEVRDLGSDDGHASDASGRLHYDLATLAMENGGDPTDHLRAAEEALVRAADLLPNGTKARSMLGLVYTRTWLWEFSHGRAADDAFERAIAAFEDSLRVDPGNRTARGQLGMLFGRRAMMELDSGADPEPFISSAIRHLDEAVGSNPKDPYNLVLLGGCYLIRARRTLATGGDPRADLLAAEVRSRSALESNPSFVSAIHNLGVVERVRATAAVERGEDPSSAVAAARDVFAGLGVDSLIEHELGELDLAEARWQETAGDDPAAAFTAAREHFDRSAGLNPEEPRIYEAKARAALAQARWLSGRGRTAAAAAAIGSGLEATGRALALMPNLARAAAVEGALLHLQAVMEPDATRRGELAAEAVARLEEALATNPLLEHSYAPKLEAARELLPASR